MSKVSTSVQSVSGSYGYYKGILEVTRTNTTETKYTYSVKAYTQMQDAASYGVQTVLTGAVSGTASGYTDTVSSGSYSTVPNTTITDTLSVTRSHSKQTKTITVQSKGVTVSGRGAAYSKTGTNSISVEIPAKTSYTVAYNANGGSGAPSSQTKWYGEALGLQTATPTRANYQFAGWNTKADGTGTSYSAGANYTTNAAVTLYAQWLTCTITYAGNGNDSGTMPIVNIAPGTTYTVVACDYVKAGYNFDCWNTNADGTGTSYAAGSSTITAPANQKSSITLYAQWIPAYSPPSFDDNQIIVRRCDSSGNEQEDGTNISIEFGYRCFHDTLNDESRQLTRVIVQKKSATDAGYGNVTTCIISYGGSGTTATFDPDNVMDLDVDARYSFGSVGRWAAHTITDAFGTDSAYQIRVTIEDDSGNTGTTLTTFLSTAEFIIDINPTGNWVAFGETADEEDVFLDPSSHIDPQTNKPIIPWKDSDNQIPYDGVLSVNPNWYVKGGIVDTIYPVGSIYMSVNNTDPGVLFGGEWQQIEDRFLLAAGSTYTAGDTGGSPNAIVPYHRHGLGSTSRFVGYNATSDGWGQGRARVATSTSSSAYTNYSTHSDIDYSGFDNTGYAGTSGNATNANMPPYLVVYVWQRIA